MAKRQLKGIVVSDKGQKTVVVRVGRVKKHARYGKRYEVHKKYKAHARQGDYKVGDRVVIEETRPISKDKKWKIVVRRSPK